MVHYGISVYPYHHSMFNTDNYYEVYKIGEDEKKTGGVAIALFGNKEDACRYLSFIENTHKG